MYRFALLMALVLSKAAYADFVEYNDRDDFFAASSTTTTIGFSELGNNVFVFEQYAHLGVHFIDGADLTRGPACATYLQDCWGLDGNSLIQLAFDAPIFAIAADFPGGLQIDLYLAGELVYSSTNFLGGGAGNFAGIVSTTGFDGAILRDWDGTQVFLDDLHFTTIPAPGGLPLLSLAALGITGRRRRDA